MKRTKKIILVLLVLIFVSATVFTTAASENQNILVNGDGKASFPDIIGHYGEQEINLLAKAGVINGYPSGLFIPDGKVTRAEFVKIVVSALALEDQGGSLNFSDNGAIKSWAAPYVKIAVQRGIVRGYEDNTFRPNRLISRQEMAAMVIRSIGLDSLAENYLAEPPFSDSRKVSPWAKNNVALAANLGLVRSRQQQQFVPTEAATRAETCMAVVYAMGLLIDYAGGPDTAQEVPAITENDESVQEEENTSPVANPEQEAVSPVVDSEEEAALPVVESKQEAASPAIDVEQEDAASADKSDQQISTEATQTSQEEASSPSDAPDASGEILSYSGAESRKESITDNPAEPKEEEDFFAKFKSVQ